MIIWICFNSVNDKEVVFTISIWRHTFRHFKNLYSDCLIDNVALDSPEKSRFLPAVLSKEEVLRLLQVTQNLKHRAILALIYSAGLRIGELIHLKLSHIDVNRRQLIVKNGKGRKDRYVILANSFLPLLNNQCI